MPGVTNKFRYYADGSLQTASNTMGVIANSFDAVNRLTFTTGAIPKSAVSYGYYPAGQISNVTTIAGTTAYTLDAADRLLGLTNGSGCYGFGYNANNGLISDMRYPNGVTLSNRFNVIDQATSLVWCASNGTTIRSLGYTFSVAGMVTNLTREDGSWTAYTYDSLDRLTSEKRYGASGGLSNSASWTYDLAGNRTVAITNGVTNIYAYAAGNLLTNFGVGTRIQYDLAGNTTNIQYSATRKLALKWNAAYELIEARTNGVLAEKYAYDALGRRSTIITGTVTNGLIYDGPHIIAETSNNVLTRVYTYNPSAVDDILGMTIYSGNTTNRLWYIKDAHGSVLALVNTNGVVVEQYRYTAWGETTVMNSNGVVLAASAYGNRLTFQGREISWATKLLFFRSRYYEPSMGRWLSKDKIGISGGLNVFAFCENCPTMYRDPLGQSGTLTIKTIANGEKMFGTYTTGKHAWIEYANDAAGVQTHYFGTWGLKNYQGLFQDHLEKSDAYQKLVTQSRSVHLDNSVEKLLLNFINEQKKLGEKAWSREHNCSSFASDAWFKVTGERLDAQSNDNWPTPQQLGTAIFKANGNKKNGELKINAP